MKYLYTMLLAACICHETTVAQEKKKAFWAR